MVTSTFTIALLGNPNCGKTTLFNALTGGKQRVGNWPGVTVEKKTGQYGWDGHRYQVVDLPGTYSLDVVDHEVSLDEMVARNYVQSGEADLLINIVDASNLERNLYLTSQLAELERPIVLALNMVDVAKGKGILVDHRKLSEKLDCPVIPIVASTAHGVNDLKQAIAAAVSAKKAPAVTVDYGGQIEASIAEMVGKLESAAICANASHRWLALRLLEGDDLARQCVGPTLAADAETLSSQLGEDLDMMVADARYTFANAVANASSQVSGRVTRDMTDRIDRIVLNRTLGIPIFLLMMYLMFMFTIKIGGAFIDFFEQASGAIFVDGLGVLLEDAGLPQWLSVMVSQGIGGGLQTVATFIPVIGFLYLFLSALEDSGYMARAAFVMDRFMRWVGLPGKSFIPMIVGFGCNVPAIMATRTLEHRRDRLITIAMAPFMSCGARLPVYVLFAAAFFPSSAQNVVFGLYLIGIVAAVVTGLLLKNSLLKGEATPFIMELPAYHLPTLKGVLIHTWDKLKGFVVRAGRIIVPMVLVLNFLNALGTDGSFGNEDSEKSVLSEIGRTIAPVFSPFGLNAENWPAAVGIFTGVLAKEAVVGTLNATYQSLAESDAVAAGKPVEPEEPFDLTQALKAAWATIPANLTEAFAAWTDPLGIQVGDLSDQEFAAEKAEVEVSVFGAMAKRFDGGAGAFAYLLFILLYFPCTAATAVVYQESGRRWAMFVVAWTTGLGYGLATLWYQVANFQRQPAQATLWIGLVCIGFALAFLAMRRHGLRSNSTMTALPVQS